MKKRKLTLLLACMHLFLFAQDNRYAVFNERKKTCDLRTGITMRYFEGGRRDGTPVIMLHGYTDTSRSFQLVIDELLQKDSCLYILAPDLRGHGYSSMPGESYCHDTPEKCFTIKSFNDDILAFMDVQGIDKAYIVGHSLGGMIAHYMGTHHPDRVYGMVTICSPVVGTQNAAIHDFVQAEMVNGVLQSNVEKLGLSWPAQVYDLTPANLGQAVIQFLEENWITESVADKGYVAAVALETLSTKLGTWIGVGRVVGAFDHRKDLEKLAVPALVLYAIQDPINPEETERGIVKACFEKATAAGNAKLSIKTYGRKTAESEAEMDLGHNFHWAVPGPVAGDLVSFIRNQTPEATHTFIDAAGKLMNMEAKDNIRAFAHQRASRH